MEKMKLTFSAGTLLALISSSGFAVAPPNHAGEGASVAKSVSVTSSKKSCSLATLKGTYVYSLSGTAKSGTVSFRESGIETYDGKGNAQLKVTYNDVPGSVVNFAKANFTYVVNPDCTGQLVSKEGPYSDIFISPDGSFFSVISTDEGVQMSGDEKRATKKLVNLE